MTTPATPTTTESFKFDTANRIVTRDSDGEVMAKLDAANVLTFTHQSREKNYGTAIRALLDAAGVPFAEPGEVSTVKDKPPTTPPPTTPPPAAAQTTTTPVATTPPPANPPAAKKAAKEKATLSPGEAEPERDPACGSYSRAHLLWDYKNRPAPDFLAKWGGELSPSTKRTVEESPDHFGDHGDDIIALLDAAPRAATPVPGSAIDVALLIRGRVADFIDSDQKLESKEDAITALAEFIAELVTDPAIRAHI